MDPLQVDYPSLSPYQFCANSPVLYKDLDGRKIYIYYKDVDGNVQSWEYKPNLEVPDNEFVKSAAEALNYVYNNSKKGARIINKAVEVSDIVNTYEDDETVFQGEEKDGSNPDLNYLGWNPLLGLEIVSNKEGRDNPIPDERAGLGDVQSPALGYVHEIIHFLHKTTSNEEKKKLQNCKSRNYSNLEEKRTVRVERRIAKQLGEPKRKNHFGKKASVDSSTSHTGTGPGEKSGGVRNL